MQIVSNEKTVRNGTIQDLKEIKSPSLATQTEKGEQLVSMMLSIEKSFDLMGDDIVDLSTEKDALRNKIGDYDERGLEKTKTKLLKQIDDDKRANLIMSRMKKKMEKHSILSYNKLWESEFDNIVSKRDKLQDINITQLKLEVHDTYKKDEKITTDSEPVNHSDVKNKAYLDEKLFKMKGLSKLEKDYFEVSLQYNKQSVEDISIQRTVKTTIQILYDKGLFDNCANADKVLQDFLFTTRRGGNLEEVNDNIQWFCS